jgi:hypothetical protein
VKHWAKEPRIEGWFPLTDASASEGETNPARLLFLRDAKETCGAADRQRTSKRKSPTLEELPVTPNSDRFSRHEPWAVECKIFQTEGEICLDIPPYRRGRQKAQTNVCLRSHFLVSFNFMVYRGHKIRILREVFLRFLPPSPVGKTYLLANHVGRVKQKAVVLHIRRDAIPNDID